MVLMECATMIADVRRTIFSRAERYKKNAQRPIVVIAISHVVNIHNALYRLKWINVGEKINSGRSRKGGTWD
jgi:hypothetical protein